jgi:Transferase family
MTHESNDIALSGYDQALGIGMPPFFRMLCYRYVPDIDILRRSLERTYEMFPRLATKLDIGLTGHSKLVAMDHAPALEIRSRMDWTPESFNVRDVSAFVGGFGPAAGQPILSATLRPVNDGAVLSASLSHAAGDFYSLYLFMSAWCEHFRSTAIRNVAAPRAATAAAAPLASAAGVKASAGTDKHNYSVLRFDRDFLDSLRDELSTDRVKLTMNEVLTAFVLHRHGRQIMGRTSGLRLRIPVNVRGVHPAIPDDFVGNGIVEAIVPLDELSDSPAAARQTALKIHAAVAAVRNKEYVESALRVLDGQVELRAQGLPVYDGQTDILATNLSKMHFQKLDFGGGVPTQIFGTHSEYNGLSISTGAEGLEVRIFSQHGSSTAQ